MALIIEGCDLSGKSTMAVSLKWPIHHKDVTAIGEVSIEDCMELDTGFEIWDRWWLSELVYGDLFRKRQLNILQMWQFKMLADVKGAVMVWLAPTEVELMKRYKDKSDTLWSVDEIFNISMKYLEHVSELNDYLPEIFPRSHLDKALFKHKKLQRYAEIYKTFHVNGWGSLFNPKVLFVGQQINKKSIVSKYPFQELVRSGEYFFDCLTCIETLKPKDVHIINVRNKDGSFGNFKGLIDWLCPEHIIALGDYAESLLYSKSIPYEKIYHPSYCNRFLHSKQGYVQQIEGILHNDS